MRESTFGHARQLESVLREHLAGLCQRVDLLPGGDGRAFIDIDSLLCPVYGHAKQGASTGTLDRWCGCGWARATSGKGAARMIAQAVAGARATGVTGQIPVPVDSASGTSTVAAAC